MYAFPDPNNRITYEYFYVLLLLSSKCKAPYVGDIVAVEAMKPSIYV